MMSARDSQQTRENLIFFKKMTKQFLNQKRQEKLYAVQK